MTTETGKRHYYVRRVDLCPPDSDGSMAVNQLDVTAFQAFMAGGHPRADFNRDGAVTAADFTAFSASYANWVP